jgi:hypothetical protein
VIVRTAGSDSSAPSLAIRRISHPWFTAEPEVGKATVIAVPVPALAPVADPAQR